MAPRLKEKSVLLLGGNWVSHSVNKCWPSLSGFGCVCWNSKNSPCFGSNVLGLYGAGSFAAAYSQCGLKSLSVCLLHMWICSTDVCWLPGRHALLPLAFLALVVTWWHTVASGVQTGSPRAKTIQSSTSLAILRPPTTSKQTIVRLYGGEMLPSLSIIQTYQSFHILTP